MKDIFKSKKIKIFLILIFLIVIDFSHIYMSIDLDRYQNFYPSRTNSGKVIWEEKKSENYAHLSEISEPLKWAIILCEDWAFFDHHGVDFNQIKIAVSEMFVSSEVRGASTISQQLVKNLFLHSDRSLRRKYEELILTMKLERQMKKEKILEWYLNVIEFGENLYGIKKASEFYFKKNPIELNYREGAFLAMLLPNPKKYSESFFNKSLTPFAQTRIDEIFLKFKMAKILTDDQIQEEKKKLFFWELNQVP